MYACSIATWLFTYTVFSNSSHMHTQSQLSGCGYSCKWNALTYSGQNNSKGQPWLYCGTFLDNCISIMMHFYFIRFSLFFQKISKIFERFTQKISEFRCCFTWETIKYTYLWVPLKDNTKICTISCYVK